MTCWQLLTLHVSDMHTWARWCLASGHACMRTFKSDQQTVQCTGDASLSSMWCACNATPYVVQHPSSSCVSALASAASLGAFGTALQLHQQRQEAVNKRNAARAAKRQQLLELQGQPGASEAQSLLEELGEDEEVPRVPAKLLNNTAVLKYRCASAGLLILSPLAA